MSGPGPGLCALVTGAASRQSFGFAIADAIAPRCVCLILCDKDEPSLDEASKVLASRHPGVQVVPLRYDVTNLSDLSNLYLECRRRVLAVEGTLDVVVNSVGATNVSDFLEDSSYLLRGLVDTSLTQLLLSTKMAFELMCKSAVSRRRNGVIINVASDAAIEASDPFRAAESVARSGLVTMPRALQPAMDLSVARHWDQNGDLQPGSKPGRVRICTLLYPADMPTPAGVKDQEVQRRVTISFPPPVLEAVLPTLAPGLLNAATSGAPQAAVTSTVADVAAAAMWIVDDATLAGRVVRVGKQRNDIWAVRFASTAPPPEAPAGKTRFGVQAKAAQSPGFLSRLRTGSTPDGHPPAATASELIKLEDVELRPPRDGIQLKL
ncbi:hypothetical protein DFJ74DRAFT_43103 [Hyaloraphidium curvatum]|nr:hypothetical protein DFJ74DRAFT_43103 [Hyaloraphidium curvatum]